MTILTPEERVLAIDFRDRPRRRSRWVHACWLVSFAFIVIGWILLAIGLAHGVNGVEGSVVDPAIRGTIWLDVLDMTMVPAWFIGCAAAETFDLRGGHSIEIMMYLAQAVLYGFIGILLVLFVTAISRSIRLLTRRCANLPSP